MASDIFDLIVILILVGFSLRGLKNGFIAEIAGIIALVGGFAAANALNSRISPYLSSITNPDFRTIVAYVLIFIAVMLLVSLIARILRRILELSFAKWIDNLAGFVFGLAKGIILCALIIMFIQAIFKDAPFLQSSHTIPYLNTLIERFREWLPDELTSRFAFHA